MNQYIGDVGAGLIGLVAGVIVTVLLMRRRGVHTHIEVDVDTHDRPGRGDGPSEPPELS